MRRKALFKAGLLALALALSTAAVTRAQVTGLYYQEVEKDDHVYVFNTPENFQSWQQTGDMGTAVTLIGRGPNGETIVAENETAIDLYLFKHNLPAYDRPTPKPAEAADYPSSKFGIRVYADASSKTNKDEATGIKSADSGVGVDVKRTYFTFTHQFDAVWSAVFQSDIGDQGARRYDVFVKKAYVQAQITPMADLPPRLRRHRLDPLRRGRLRPALRRADDHRPPELRRLGRLGLPHHRHQPARGATRSPPRTAAASATRPAARASTSRAGSPSPRSRA